MAKPTLSAEFATSGTAQKVAPGASRVSSGWLAGDEPPAEEENYLLNVIGQWLAFLDGIVEPFRLTTTLSPAALSGTNNDYAPTGHGAAAIFRLTVSSGTPVITGLAGGAEGRVVVLTNIHATNSIDLSHDTGGSSAANRFFFHDAATKTIPPLGGTITLFYDDTTDRWRMQSKNF